ncbi:MAG TPA: hypothetical protein ENJ05_00235 [Thiotrichales bacterium]|nr:hypothetical protein [Thiotrichales bacterium]
MAQTASSPPSFVIAATLAGRLYRVMRIARAMSLSASNAKGVAARAGEKAMGFRPITDFIAEMANTTIHHATKINQHALSVSRASVAAERARQARHYLQRAADRFEGGQRGTEVIARMSREADRHQEALDQDIRELIRTLSVELEEIHQTMRGANIIVTNSRTEASRAGDFRPYLESIADSVESAASDIQGEIGTCQALLEQLKKAS